MRRFSGRGVLRRGSFLNIVGWVVVLSVIATIVAAFLIVGSPAQARREKADEQRVSDLEEICRSVWGYQSQKKSLPADLEASQKITAIVPERLLDPETSKPYEYRVADKDHFEVCATFQTDQSQSRTRNYYSGYYTQDLPFWKHKEGRQCFTLPAKEPKRY